METGQALDVGNLVPHFTVSTPDGSTVDYSTIWQTRILVLMTLPAGFDARATQEELRRLDSADTATVVTQEALPGLPTPAVLVADKWGEIVHITAAATADALPTAVELAEWIDHVRQRCPECEGEAR